MTLLLNSEHLIMNTAGYLWIDIFTLLTLSISMAWTGSNPNLTKHLPVASLMYAPVFVSVACLAFINLGFQVLALVSVKQQPFYTPPV